MAKAKKKQQLGKKILIGAAIGLLCGFLAWLLSYTPLVRMVEFITRDMRFKYRTEIRQLPEVGYVNMDTESCDMAGQWPWTRNFHVAMVKTLKFYDARAAGYDVFFIEPSNVYFKPSEAVSGGNSIDAVLSQSLRDYDAEFEQALKESGIIYLGEYLTGPEQVNMANASDKEISDYITEDIKKWSPEKKESMAEATKRSLPVPDFLVPTLKKQVEVSAPQARFTRAGAGLGFEQIIPDDITGTVYEYPMFLYYDGRLYPSLGLLIAADTVGIDLNKIRGETGKYIEMTSTKPFGGIKPGSFRIPINKKSRVFMNWSGPYFDTFFHVSFKQLSYYYAYNRAKEKARAEKPAAQTAGRVIEDISAMIRREKMVPQDQVESVARDVVIAQLIQDAPGMKAHEAVAACGAFAPEETCLRVFEAVRLAEEARKKAKPEALRYVSEHIADPEHLNVPGMEIDREKYGHLSIDHQKEIVRNVLAFLDKGRIDEVSPLYFPPCLSTLNGGGKIPLSPTMLSGKVLMIGLEGEGTIDLNPQPYEKACAMVAMHANAINTIISRQFLSWPDPETTLTLIFAFAVAIGVITYTCSAVMSLAITAICAVLFCAVSHILFSSYGKEVEAVPPLLSLLIAYLASMGIQLYLAFREKQKVKGMFGKMVSPDVLKVMYEDPEAFSLTGRRQACTSFFSSMEGFSDISKGVTSQEMIRFLSHYLTPCSQIITSYSGYIDKYESHIIMADFGVPIPDLEHTIKCLYAGIEQQLDINAFKKYAYARFGKQVTVSMGMNTGYVSAGNMGSDKKMQYTIMGDTVNTAARFRPANWIYNNLGSIIIGEMTYPLVREFIEVRMLDKLLLKGKLKPVTIYQVMGWRPEVYLKLRGDSDVQQILRLCWSRCPPEKIYGYALCWKHHKERLGSSLAGEIQAFFEDRIGLASEMLELEMKGEISRTWRGYSELLVSFSRIMEKPAPEIKAAEWKGKLGAWVKNLEEEMEALRPKTKENAEAQNLYLSLGELSGKVEALAERMDMSTQVDPRLEAAWDRIRSYAGKDFHSDSADFAALYEAKFASYESDALRMAEKTAMRKKEYHEMMAQVGSRSKKQIIGCKAFEEGLHLHWERKWDESTAKFREALASMPDDNASLCFIDRVEGYKKTPPKDAWQGEFVQTKK